MAIEASLFLLGLNVNDFTADPNGLPEGAIGYVNFADRTYWFGENVTLDSVFGDDSYFTDVITPEEINEDGWAPAGTSSTGFLGEAQTMMFDGCTFTAEMNLAAANSGFDIQLLDIDTFDPAFQVFLGQTGGNSTGITSDGNDFETNSTEFLPEGLHKVACTMIDGKIAASIDGAALISISRAWNSPPDRCGMTFRGQAGAYVVSLVFYPPQLDADLPGLSSL